jgi:hypothetical protein
MNNNGNNNNNIRETTVVQLILKSVEEYVWATSSY